jgi:hypothetical protein
MHGEQPFPLQNNNASCHDCVTADLVRKGKYHIAADIQKRRAIGIQRYGTPLQPHNHRDMTRDAYEEILDFVVYVKGCVLEGKKEWELIYEQALLLLIETGKIMLRD